MKLMTSTEASYGAKTEIGLAERIAWIEETNVVTPSTRHGLPCMEFTTPHSPITPAAYVTGRVVNGAWAVEVEAGPGQTLGAEWRAAYEIAARRRAARNAKTRMGGIAA